MTHEARWVVPSRVRPPIPRKCASVERAASAESPARRLEFTARRRRHHGGPLSHFSDDADGPSAAVISAVATGDVRLAISDDQLSELVRVMGYEGVEDLVGRPVRAFEVALDIGTMGLMYHPRRLDWPSLRDPKDGWIFDLAYASGADFIVSNDNAVRDAADALGFVVLPPEDLLEALRHQYEP